MKKQNTPPTLVYYALIALIGIELIVATISGIYTLQALINGGNYVITGIAALIFGVAIIPTNRLQLKYRDLVEYDEFGQSRKHNDMTKLSAAERKKIEEAKMIDSERILPTSELNAMVHKGSKEPVAEMEKLIGLPQIKVLMHDLAAQMEYDKEYGSKKKHKDEETKSYHMCFSGPPGTGKTTVARIMTGLLYKYGLIRENKCIETDGNIFHGVTPAEATFKTQKILHKASGGLLFIDEAYALNGNGTSNREVIATLIKEMEDNRDGIVIILAGYENEMKALIESNPGFKSRIQQYFNFEPYTIKDLKQIFEKMASAAGFTVSEMAYERFEELISPMMHSKHFGNGRTVRNILQTSIDRHKVNCVRLTSLSKEEKINRIKTLAYEDIIAPRSI